MASFAFEFCTPERISQPLLAERLFQLRVDCSRLAIGHYIIELSYCCLGLGNISVCYCGRFSPSYAVELVLAQMLIAKWTILLRAGLCRLIREIDLMMYR